MPDPEQQPTNILDNIIERPAMYWGNSDNHFRSFMAFLAGYDMARNERLTEAARKELDEIIPPKFHEFVTAYYGHKFPHGGYGWRSFIEENSKSDKDALALFMSLRQLCKDEQS